MRAPRAWLLRVGVALISALLWSGIAASQESELVRAKALSRQVIQLHRDGRHDEAIPFAKEALAIQEKALGAEHPDVAMSLNTLGVLYKTEGRYAEAGREKKHSCTSGEKGTAPGHSAVGQRRD